MLSTLRSPGYLPRPLVACPLAPDGAAAVGAAAEAFLAELLRRARRDEGDGGERGGVDRGTAERGGAGAEGAEGAEGCGGGKGAAPSAPVPLVTTYDALASAVARWGSASFLREAVPERVPASEIAERMRRFQETMGLPEGAEAGTTWGER